MLLAVRRDPLEPSRRNVAMESGTGLSNYQILTLFQGLWNFIQSKLTHEKISKNSFWNGIQEQKDSVDFFEETQLVND